MSGPAIGHAQPRSGPAARLLLALNVASLDAPLVAVVWAALLARAAGRRAEPAELALLAAGVWLGYAADRLLDGRRLGARAATARHRAAARHPLAIGSLWLVVLVAAMVAAWTQLAPQVLQRGIALAALVAAYTLAVALWPGQVRRLIPRELVVGALFAAGTSVFAFGATLPSASALLLASGFTALCVVDCAAVALGEAAGDRAAGEVSWATEWPGLASAFAPVAASLGFVALLAATLASGSAVATGWLALAAAAAGLVALHRSNRPISTLPTAADLCLCVPAALALLLS
ncbi:hypothetical protein [Engelhardtia mirabilis]|uniref:Prenyltransferase n=1 Tax=Engelhardtia mirabilis TaxID=2528011 RepID=A0A518BHX7_9BACT|nr:hypothetical protein Pla133_16570 [Planctomycetes bacterium Pla133]QDV00907.1 hypothetical protein Pla86_16560 [Planctomycetes bacterium Pla86]